MNVGASAPAARTTNEAIRHDHCVAAAEWWTADYALSPYWPAAAAVALVLATGLWVVRGRTARGLIVGFRILAWGAVAAATLTPIPRTSPPCVLSLSGSGWWAVGSWSVERLLNIMLFVPVGLTIPTYHRRGLALVVAALAPFAIEAAQALVPRAGRFCDVNDIAANLLGLAAGVVLGAVCAPVVSRRWTGRPVSPSDAGSVEA